MVSPDACLINRYEPGARMSLHQDRDNTFGAPIVSVSLTAAIFMFRHQAQRQPRHFRLEHADIAVWGGHRGCSSMASRRSRWRTRRADYQRVNLTFAALRPASSHSSGGSMLAMGPDRPLRK
jgi:alkylated DNA repair protein (DNA oxidative demethylase)